MSDRTWAVLRFHKKDKAAFAEIWGKDFDEKDNQYCLREYNNSIEYSNIYEFHFDEVNYDGVNYGGYRTCEEMADQNLTFWYEHGHGGGYMGSIIVGFFGDFQVMESDNMGSVLIPVKQKNGTAYVEPTALESATDFFKVQELVEKYFRDCRDPEFVAEVVKRKMKSQK